MKRKMLISIALITIMLLNCMMPLLVVNANMSGGEEIQLNSKLYKAIKSSLYQEGIVFESDDITHTITISPEEKAKVKKLNLNESAIFDITGIEAFSAVEHLELSGNNLSKESNLAVLNSLTALNYLDLSTNQLDDVSDISELISKLQKNGTVILSGQTVTQVNSVFIDSEEESDQVATASFELPGILELAGYLKSVWKEEKRYSQRINPTESSLLTPYIEKAPMYVKSDDNLIEITIADKDTGIGYYGMVKFTIYIYDDATEAAQANNPNRASENILNGSRFYLYYVIHDSSSEAITTMDTNLYRAIKEQLTGGQTVNSDLTSYPYVVNKDGDMVYEEFTYTTEEIGRDTYKVLTNIKTGEIQYAINSENGDIYSYNGTGMPSFINTHYETIEIKSVDENGNVSIKEGYKVAFKGDETGETLYVAAYDDAKTFVINDLVLTNKITSLILNNRQIRDLSGIEKFIGLNSELNVSHNYLSDIDPIYSLQEHKDYWEAQMIETFTHWLKTRQYGNLSKSTSAVNTAKKGVEDQIKNIEKTKNLIFNILVDAGTLESSAEDYESQIKSKIDTINGYLDTIYGYTAESGEHVDGYLDIIDKHLNDAETGLNKELNSMYSYLGILYDLYNNKYKLTTFLADDVNYMTYEEYEAYKNATETSRDSAYQLLVSQINYVKSLESHKSLTDLDKIFFSEWWGINLDDPQTQTPISNFFDKMLENNAMNRTTIVNYLNVFREMGLYSEMANYCLIQRMNDDTAAGYCYEKEYLEKRMEELKLEEIPMDLENAVLEAIERYDETSEINAPELTDLFNLYIEYTETMYNYTNEGLTESIYMCCGEYKEVNRIIDSHVSYTDEEVFDKVLEMIESASEEEVTTNTDAIRQVLNRVGRSVINYVELFEMVNGYQSEANKLYVYNQLMSLSNRLINGNVQRYVILPDLKALDISYNADLYNLEGLTTLKSLYDLNAAYCYIADVTNVEWAQLSKLRKLNLAYNYISDISPITELTTLKSLNLSNNLIEGKLDISEYQYEKLFKKLEELNLSGNKISDITSLLIYLDYVTNGNYANYIAQENSIDINLNNQKLTIDIEEPINLKEYPTTIDIELPKIFTQLLAIDTERTAFGENSQDGRIESEGTYVTLNTRTEGDKTGEVVVIPMTGNGQEVDTCVGAGTTLKIKYKVVAPKVTEMKVTPNEDVTVKAGETKQFTVEITGENLVSNDVIWEVENAQNENTTISEKGLLTVDAEETSEKLMITVTSKDDESVKVRIDVAVTVATDNENEGTTNPGEGNEGTTNPGEGNEGTTNPGEGNEGTTNPGEGNEGTTNPGEGNEGTTNPGEGNEGTTNPGEGNEGTTNPGEGNEGTTNPEVDVIDTATLGYTVGEEYLTGVSAKTPVEDFKTILLKGKEYNVVIKKDGKTITSGNMSTGMFVQVQDKDGNLVKDKNGDFVVYEIVVKGDVNGDGLANSLDSMLIKAYRNEVTALDGAVKAAADINNDGKVNLADSKLLLYHRAEVTGYNLNYTK